MVRQCARKKAVVIIAYKAQLSGAEEASLEQCLRILGKENTIVVACPESLDLDTYHEKAASLNCTLTIVRFADAWFSSVSTYNKLMLSVVFYEKLSSFDYILIYQLDAWVFRDEFSLWCTKGYKYVGAPFLNGHGELLPFLGNGGFSLRHVPSFIDILRQKRCRFRNFRAAIKYIFFVSELYERTALKRIKELVFHLLEVTLIVFSTKLYYSVTNQNEDYFFSKIFLFSEKNAIPEPHEAAYFSFERFPRHLFVATKGELPFGCHAYAKYDYEFWKQWIRM